MVIAPNLYLTKKGTQYRHQEIILRQTKVDLVNSKLSYKLNNCFKCIFLRSIIVFIFNLLYPFTSYVVLLERVGFLTNYTLNSIADMLFFQIHKYILGNNL